MCGIAGYIGTSKYPSLSFKIATRLFERLESRGTDASGYYGAEGHNIHYHKQPIKSSAYVKTEPWKKLHDKNCDMLIMHARGASKGQPEDNRNNHPFLNQDQTLAFIHNGTLTEMEYVHLRKRYEVESACDSEILMRIILSADGEKSQQKFPNEKPEIAHRLMGLCDVFSLINHGHMAVAVAENTYEEKRLWLFRNQHRPLWIIDAQESLGQIWFCSTPDIWAASVGTIRELRGVPAFSRNKIHELLTKEVWLFSLADSEIKYKRFSINQDKQIPWQPEKPNLLPPAKNSEYVGIMKLIRDTLGDIDLEYSKVENENSLTPQGYAEFVTRLHNINQDLQSVKRDLER